MRKTFGEKKIERSTSVFESISVHILPVTKSLFKLFYRLENSRVRTKQNYVSGSAGSNAHPI